MNTAGQAVREQTASGIRDSVACVWHIHALLPAKATQSAPSGAGFCLLGHCRAQMRMAARWSAAWGRVGDSRADFSQKHRRHADIGAGPWVSAAPLTLERQR
ncbi:hypothetical protein GCM10009566_49000 [Streptomyces murinus]